MRGEVGVSRLCVRERPFPRPPLIRAHWAAIPCCTAAYPPVPKCTQAALTACLSCGTDSPLGTCFCLIATLK
ncbi:hypothetical protein E2C01_035754 [Portunus trituberculatus]|uniref:Uncharacterized protein n=1 Tax=Portunus trituberculatus TaxID=210409 RepID=A0A5B7F551_PORTR|nr:hypothetical protein [Portunus trituberculatus]